MKCKYNKMARSVFITGASSGIGFSLAREFASRGYKVYAGARSVDKMEPLTQLGVKTFSFDTTSEESMLQAKKFIEEDNGGVLDILYLNAGMGIPGTLFDTPISKMQDVFNTNVFGQILLIQVFHKLLLKSKGTIAFTGSTSIHMQMPFSYAYTASKYAFDILAKQVALEASKLGIKSFIVRTGAVESDIWKPPYVPPQDSVYFIGDGEPLAKSIKTKKTPSAVYTKDVINSLESAVKKNRVYTCVYKGAGARLTWYISCLPFVSGFIPFVYSFLGLNEPIEKVAKNLENHINE